MAAAAMNTRFLAGTMFDRVFGGLSSAMAAARPEPASIFDNYGVVAAKRRSAKPIFEPEEKLTAADVRDRIPELAKKGTFTAKTFEQLKSYLAERGFSL